MRLARFAWNWGCVVSAMLLSLGAALREGDWEKAIAWGLVALWMSDIALAARDGGEAG